MTPRGSLISPMLSLRGSLMLWIFWLLLLVVGLAAEWRHPGVRQLPSFVVAFPTLFAGWHFGMRLWLLDRDARGALLPGHPAALRRAITRLIIIFVLSPALLLAAVGADLLFSLSLLGAALVYGAVVILLPAYAAVLLLLAPFLLSRHLSALLGDMGTPAGSGLFALTTAMLAAVLVFRWRHLQLADTGQDGLTAPVVMGPLARFPRAPLWQPQNATFWWMDARKANVNLGDAGPDNPERALAIMSGPPLAPQRFGFRLRDLLVAAAFLLALTLVSSNPQRMATELIPLTGIMLAPLLAAQCIQRMREERRRSSLMLAEARLLPGLERSDTGWAQLLRMFLGRISRFAVLGSAMVLLGLAIDHGDIATGYWLALLPLWISVLVTTLLPALLASGFRFLSASIIGSVAFLYMVITWIWGIGDRHYLLSGNWWLAGLFISALAALTGYLTLRKRSRAPSPFLIGN